MEEKNKNLENKKTETKTESLVHDFNKENLKSAINSKIILLSVGIVVIGLVSGYLLSGSKGVPSLSGSKNGGVYNGSSASKGTIVGSSDTTTFKDTAEGTLKEGGIDGEGAFHLERSGGSSQNVYLTSATVDLSKFINKKIKVWGQTQKAQTAGWLMDVGRVEVL